MLGGRCNKFRPPYMQRGGQKDTASSSAIAGLGSRLVASAKPSIPGELLNPMRRVVARRTN
jgi:hypothetical protein